MRVLLLLVLALMLLLPGAALADDEVPTLAFLRFGEDPVFALTDAGVLDMLQAYGYIDADERAQLDGGSDLHGENINILYRDANFDFATAALMVEDALDEGADILITVSNAVGLLAARAIGDMDEPPALIFAIVTTPYDIGLAQSPCVKPPFVGGTEMTIPWQTMYELPFQQIPDLDSMGVIADPSDSSFPPALRFLESYSADLGIALEVATATTAAEVGLAAQQLVDDGVDWIYLPPRTSPLPGIPAIVQAAYEVVVFSTVMTDVFEGVTVAGGFEGWYTEGMNAARLAVGVMRADIDLASTGIASTPSHYLALNLHSAELQGIEISQDLQDAARFVIGAEQDPNEIFAEMFAMQGLPDLPLEERIAADREFFDSLHCTAEMIAEQQAALGER